MKKKISIFGLILILTLSIAGCGSSEKTEYDTSLLSQYADYIIQNFTSMPEEAYDTFYDMSELQLDLTLLNTGIPVSGEHFLTMMESWEAGIKECGQFVNLGEYTSEVSNDGITLTADIEFTDRSGTISFVFDESQNMESMTINAKYSTGEILQKAGMNTILGMGTVFVVLIFLSFIISLFGFIPAIEKKFKTGAKEEAAKPAVPAPVQAEPSVTEETEDEELVAVIAAAIAAAEGTSTDGFVVRSIKRRKSNKWN